MRRIALTLALSLCSLPALAAMQVKPLDWTIGEERFSGFLVYDDAGGDTRPGLVMVPNWMGVNDLAVGRNVEEVLRVLDALQTDKLCPCNWHKGEKTLN